VNESTCVNHPERAAVERCEVCGSALCAYCLYYTSDGQRLCKQHAEEAGAAGAFIRAPGVYPTGLVGAQVSAEHTQPLLQEINTPYRGNMTDLLALLSLLLGIISLGTCLILPICALAPLGLIFGVLALVGAKGAYDGTRTRTLATVGLVLSVLWFGAAFSCYSFSRTAVLSSGNASLQLTLFAPGIFVPRTNATPAPPQSFIDTATPTFTATSASGR